MQAWISRGVLESFELDLARSDNGQDVMPAQPQVSVTEARALAQYILSVK